MSLNGVAPVKIRIQIDTARHFLTVAVSPATDLDRNPCKRENVRFLAARVKIFQDLWRDPSRARARVYRSIPYQVQIVSDHGQPKVCDPCVVGLVHEYVRLIGGQHGGTKSRVVTHSLEIPVNDVA